MDTTGTDHLGAIGVPTWWHPPSTLHRWLPLSLPHHASTTRLLSIAPITHPRTAMVITDRLVTVGGDAGRLPISAKRQPLVLSGPVSLWWVIAELGVCKARQKRAWAAQDRRQASP